MNNPSYKESQESIDELDKQLESVNKLGDIEMPKAMLSEPDTSPEIISKKISTTHATWIYWYFIALFLAIGTFDIFRINIDYHYASPTLTDRFIIQAPMLMHGFIIALSIYLYVELSTRFGRKWHIKLFSFFVYFALSNYSANLNDSTISRLNKIERAEYLEENTSI